MSIKNEYTAGRAFILSLIFVIIAVLLFITAGHWFKVLLQTKVQTAVEMGAPIYSYDENKPQRSEGELKKSEVVLPSIGCKYGMITCEAIGLKTSLYYGDTENILANGAGQYTGSGLPGEGKLILIGGHDIGCFGPLEKIEEENIIELNTSYGKFRYQVTDIIIAETDYISENKLKKNGEKLILYTCYPFGEIMGDNSKRFYVSADKIAGPVLVED